ncbi:TPA: DinI-like family protein [Citrobacter werkmanii]|nr:DinI-like family protein [Citrobacter werkmanii]
MKVEITIDRTKELPKGAVLAFEKELLRRISQDYSDCKLTIRRTESGGLSVFGGEKSDKKRIEEILQETWESANECFFN